MALIFPAASRQSPRRWLPYLTRRSCLTAKSRSTISTFGRASTGCGSLTRRPLRHRRLLIGIDALYSCGEKLTARPLRERRALLEEAVAGGELVFPVRRLASNGLEAWAQVLERGYEGYVAKDEASPYIGGKTTSWLKVKVPGWTDRPRRGPGGA